MAHQIPQYATLPPPRVLTEQGRDPPEDTMRISRSNPSSDPTVAARIPSELRQRLIAAAADEGIPYSHLIRRLIEEALCSDAVAPSSTDARKGSRTRQAS